MKFKKVKNRSFKAMKTVQMHEMYPLKDLCTISVGGAARYMLEVKTITDMQEILAYCKEQNLEYIILGKGSNCLFADQGYDGVVIVNKIDFCQQSDDGVFRVGAGFSFARLGALTARNGWSGLEFAAGIPGTVGGAVYMNAGAGGCETCEHLQGVEYIDSDGELIHADRDELTFGYRHSPFQGKSSAIVSATFQLSRSSTAKQKQIDLVNYRKSTQPYKAKSAGCIFRNPPGAHAGGLIEKAGLKGLTIGGAQVSPVHANFIVNMGSATAHDLLALIDHVRETVKTSSGYDLISELCIIPSSKRGDSQ